MKKLFAKPLIKGILKSLPFVGEVVTNVDAANGESRGKVDPAELVQAVIRLVILFAILKGILTTDEAEGVIDAIK